MSILGGFSEEAFEQYQRLAAEKEGIDFAEGDVYDFTRCMRPNGTFYGTRGRCKSGSDAGSKVTAETQPKAAAAKKPRASAAELREHQRGLYDTAKQHRAAAREAEKAHKANEKKHRGNNSPEARKSLAETGRAVDKANTQADRSHNAWMKAHDRWGKAVDREKRAKMSPSQRAEARRVDKIIKERG